MPYLLSTSFDRFLANITIGGDLRATANARRDNISLRLKDRFTILDIFPTGSLIRGTGLKGKSDVDVMLVLHYGRHVEGRTPKRLLDDVREALSTYDARIVKKNGQAVTLYFKTWPNVDIVPAKRVTVGNGYVLQIPDINTGDWISTYPSAHDRAMAALPVRRRQLVRMIKSWNAAHSETVLSYHIEQIALQAGEAHDGSWDEAAWPWAINRFFDKAIELTEPTAPMSVPYNVEEWSEMRDRLRRAQGLSLDAWYAMYKHNDVENAVSRYRILFGDAFPAYG
jgi:hypothetical protein